MSRLLTTEKGIVKVTPEGLLLFTFSWFTEPVLKVLLRVISVWALNVPEPEMV